MGAGSLVRGSLRPPGLKIYFPLLQIPDALTVEVIVRTTVDPTSMAAALRKVVRELDKEQPITSIKTMKEVISGHLAMARFHMVILDAFAFVSLVLSAIGV